MLQHPGRQVDTRHPANLAGPQPGRVDDDLSFNSSVVGDDVGDAVALTDEIGDPNPFEHLASTGFQSFGVGVGEAVGVNVAVAGDEGRADQAGGRQQWVKLGGFARTEELHFEPEAAPGGGCPLQFEPAVLARRQAEAAHPFPPDVLSGLVGKRLEETGAVLHDPSEVGIGPELADQPYGMPGGPIGQSTLLD